jgi:hypothetical protein
LPTFPKNFLLSSSGDKFHRNADNFHQTTGFHIVEDKLLNEALKEINILTAFPTTLNAYQSLPPVPLPACSKQLKKLSQNFLEVLL